MGIDVTGGGVSAGKRAADWDILRSRERLRPAVGCQRGSRW